MSLLEIEMAAKNICFFTYVTVMGLVHINEVGQRIAYIIDLLIIRFEMLLVQAGNVNEMVNFLFLVVDLFIKLGDLNSIVCHHCETGSGHTKCDDIKFSFDCVLCLGNRVI
jgi:hypothetical protein